jgi:hypothetical protein
MWNYAIPLLTALIALMQLAKDWGGHKATWRRALVLLAIVALGVGGLINAYRNTQRASEQASTIKALTAAVATANASQVQNTKIFTDSIERFSAKLNKLETGIQTADLREEADHLRAELTKTQKALVIPEAVLTPGIVDPHDPDNPQFSTYVTASNGLPIAFDVSIWNEGTVPARTGFLIIRICDACKYHTEPPGFTHVKGAPEKERVASFIQLPIRVNLQWMPIEVDVPDNVPRFQVAFKYTCENCVAPREWKSALVNVTRLGTHKMPVPQPKAQ